MDEWDQMMMGGAAAFYGEYTVSLQAAGDSVTRSVQVLKDPRTPISDEQLKENIRRKEAFNHTADQITKAYKKVELAMKSMEKVEGFLGEDDALKAELRTMEDRAEKLKYAIIPKISKGILGETPDLKSQFLALSGYYFNPMVEPEENSQMAFRALQEKVKAVGLEIEDFNKDYEAFRQKVNDKGLTW
jgi:hypothetical protein